MKNLNNSNNKHFKAEVDSFTVGQADKTDSSVGDKKATWRQKKRWKKPFLCKMAFAWVAQPRNLWSAFQAGSLNTLLHSKQFIHQTPVQTLSGPFSTCCMQSLPGMPLYPPVYYNPTHKNASLSFKILIIQWNSGCSFKTRGSFRN